MNKETITVDEAARRLDVHPRTVRRSIRAGKIRAYYGGVMKNRIKGVYSESIYEILKNAERGN